MENGAPYSDGNDDRRAQWINGYLGQVRRILPFVPCAGEVQSRVDTVSLLQAIAENGMH